MADQIPTENRDLSSKEGWDRYLAHQLELNAKAYADGEVEVADCSLILVQDPYTEKPFPTPAIYICATIFTGKDDKDIERFKNTWATLVRSLAVTGKAIASLFASEAWMSVQRIDGPRLQPRNDPERTEVVLVNSDHRTFGPKSWQAPIDHVDGKRTIRPWQETSPIVGRMGSFLPPLRAMNDPVVHMAAHAFIEIQKKKGIMEEIFRRVPQQPS